MFPVLPCLFDCGRWHLALSCASILKSAYLQNLGQISSPYDPCIAKTVKQSKGSILLLKSQRGLVLKNSRHCLIAKIIAGPNKQASCFDSETND